MIWIEKVYEIGFYGLGKTPGLKFESVIANEELKNIEVSFLIMQSYFQNTYQSCILSLVHYWEGNISESYPSWI